MLQKAKFLIFCMIFAVKVASCQNLSVFSFSKALHQPVKKPENKLIINAIPVNKSSIFINNFTIIPVVSPGFYASNLGFFCKQEIKLEKNLNVPFRFRLGSVQSCDRLEGKPNTFLQGQ